MNMRNTIQRDLIIDAVHQLDHPTADTIYTYVKQLHPAISLGTIYRNLTLLVNLGQIRKVALTDSADRFDKTLVDHYHLICRGCGNMVDVHLADLDRMMAEMSDCNGYIVETYDIVLRGLCPACQQTMGPASVLAPNNQEKMGGNNNE